MSPHTITLAATTVADRETSPREPAARVGYIRAALAALPRLLGSIDRNPYRDTYGCLDRQFWHYRTSSFPSEMYQEGVLPLALVYAHRLPGNGWHGEPRVRELAIAALRFAARQAHADGSCDDYYPFERALGAAVFSLQAAARAYELLQLDDAEIRAWLERRARWVAAHNESGLLANHHALAALGLARVAQVTGRAEHADAARQRLDRLLAWQSDEGWFPEYGGADPGYQTVTIDCLAKLHEMTKFASERLSAAIDRGLRFARLFLHPDRSYGGEYGSRGTYHFYPHGCELLAATHAPAADLADGFLTALACGTQAAFDDDRLYVHRLGNLIEAFLDWSPVRAVRPAAPPGERVTFLPEARLLVRNSTPTYSAISAARGGVFKHFDAHGRCTSDAGLVVETTAGRVAVSQRHEMSRELQWVDSDTFGWRLTVAGPLDWARFETVGPCKQALLHLGMLTVGRFCRTITRRLLQRRLIRGRRPCPIRLTRSFEFLREHAHTATLRVVDHVELLSAQLRVRRMSFGCDHQTAYTAAAGVYQRSMLEPWTDLSAYVDELNRHRQVTITREW